MSLGRCGVYSAEAFSVGCSCPFTKEKRMFDIAGILMAVFGVFQQLFSTLIAPLQEFLGGLLPIG